MRFRPGEHFRCGNTLRFQRRDVTRKDRFGNQRQRFAQIQRALAGPFTGPFVGGFIKNDIHQVITVFIFFSEDVFSDVDQITAQLAVIPLSKSVRQLFIAEVQAAFQQGVSFSDKLHIAIFNTIVDHLDVVTRTIGADIGHARFAIFRHSSNLRQDRRHQFIGIFLTARHDRWPFQRALFTTGNTGTDKVKTFRRQLAIATDCVLEEGVTAINNDIAFFQIRFQRIDSSISTCARFHH
ncbi:hypothetical protein NGUA15_04979 [Salmonella enterica]|nr:hypothetical protein NGUA15_04979 [Salmonella enterica]